MNGDGVLTPSALQGPLSVWKFLMSIVANTRECLGMDEQDYIMNREEYVHLRIPGYSEHAVVFDSVDTALSFSTC
jgi:hypothetical protein